MTGDDANVQFTTADIPTVSFTAAGFSEETKIYPGWESEAKEVSITSQGGNVEVNYVCTLKVTANNSTSGDLVVKVTNSDGENAVDEPLSEETGLTSSDQSVQLASGKITGNKTEKFTYTVSLKETNKPQTLEEGNTFAATVSCGLDSEGTKTLYYYNGAEAPTGSQTAPVTD